MTLNRREAPAALGGISLSPLLQGRARRKAMRRLPAP
jgi:hypothetical protein